MEKRRLYMDYSATTPTKKEVVEENVDAFLNLLRTNHLLDE